MQIVGKENGDFLKQSVVIVIVYPSFVYYHGVWTWLWTNAP